MKQTPVIFDSIFAVTNSFLEKKKYSGIIILADSHTHEFCLPLFLPEIETHTAVEIIEIPAGEENKTLEIAIQVWETLTETNASRKSLMINLGGGMITDIGGFIASTFKRGIDFINVPTSLLSMVDASVGGKTGIDLNGYKNMVGTFAMPEMTLIHPEFLKTLPEREFLSGLAEMFKHGLIYDKSHWKNLVGIKNYEPGTVSGLIKDSVNIKKQVIENDPFETGLRKVLNFGHTVGHALESQLLNSASPLLHGEAVAAGMMVESILSYENELISKDELDEIFINLTRVFGKTPIEEESIPDLLLWMKNDKKNQNAQIGFSLLNGIGKCKFDIFLSESQIVEAIIKYNRKIES